METIHISGKTINLKFLFKFLSGSIGVLTFIPLIWILFIGNSGASFAAFTFWTLIAGINTIVTIKEKGNYIFPLALTLGNFCTALTLLITKQFLWGTTEWVTLFLVFISLFSWVMTSPSLTLIVSTVAISLAGIPQIILAWKNPSSISIPIWIGFLVASVFGILGGKNWSLRERLYPTARFIIYVLIIITALVANNYFK